MRVEIITIGDEILYGHTVDTNSAHIGRRLAEIGVELEWITSVGDAPDRIRRAFETAAERSDAVIVTGGLGPTHDDVTRDVFSTFCGRELVPDEAILEQIRERFRRRGMEMPESNRSQAMIVEGASIIENKWGTAPGTHLEQDGVHFFLLPGVPREMEGMMAEYVLPALAQRTAGRIIRHLTLRTTGVSESALYDRLSEIEGLDALAFLPGLSGVDMRITVREEDEKAAQRKVEAMAEAIRARVGEHIYTTGDEALEEIIGRELKRRGWRIAVAESCTGGLIGARLTNVSGSSAYFDRSLVTYSNESKIELLGIPAVTIEQYGAVSDQTARAMAEGVRGRAGVEVGLSVTGIAGPTGGTPEKPVGQVYIGLSTPAETTVREFRFTGNRATNRERTAQAALEMVRRMLTST